MDSLAWVDQTYITKHQGENPDDLRAMYYPNLKLYGGEHGKGGEKKSPYDAMIAFGMRFGRRAALSLAVYIASFVPVVGRFVLPAASFYTFNKAVGTPAAVAIFSTGIFLPKRYLVMFLQSYFSSRSLMRDLVGALLKNALSFANNTTASTLLLAYSLHQGPEETLVPRPRRRIIRLCRCFLHPAQDTTGWRPHLWRSGSFNCLPHHQNHRATSTTI